MTKIDPLMQGELLTMTSDIVQAHVANNSVAIDAVPALIANTFAALQACVNPPPAEEPKPVAAVTVRASIKPDHLISMIDGKPYKMLRRHIGQHGYTEESYRKAFDLPADYPMAASYADRRRELALQIGLGRKGGSASRH